ncbi:enterotoxin A family protein [Xenorhabdus sp. SGI246]|uniref:enterotoxin A family protein n=1 Tax=Xenorhabdus sp. SGI246 TaxID=3158263 RepID=UPI00349FC557
MRILKLFSLLCVLFLYISQSYAQQQVNKVYRMDTRPPERIFRTTGGGFSPWGTNNNIVEHVQEYGDIEHAAAASAFVSTTANEEVAIDWGVNFENRQTFYIYDIRPTTNFYSVILSLQNLYAQTGNTNYLRLINVYEDQEEYVAIRGIAVTQIRGAQEFLYDWVSNAYVEGDYISNRVYQDLETTANVGPYISSTQLPREVVTTETYCALNLSTFSRRYDRLAASTHTYPFLRKWKQCHDGLSITAFLSASFL